MMIKAVAAYIANTFGTPRRFSSFQKEGRSSLVSDIYARVWFSAIYDLKVQKSNDAWREKAGSRPESAIE